MIHIDGTELIAQLDEHGWAQGVWTASDGAICAHQAIRLCAPQPGDAHLIEAVATAQGWGTDWNDDAETTETDVRARLAGGVDVTDSDLADVFGPQWRAVVRVVRKAAALTPCEADELAAARYAARGAARDAARNAARNAARRAARGAARNAARRAARDATWYVAWYVAWDATRRAAWYVAWYAAKYATWDVAWVAVVWDLATPDGPFTVEQRDLLISSWLAIDPGLVDEFVEVTR